MEAAPHGPPGRVAAGRTPGLGGTPAGPPVTKPGNPLLSERTAACPGVSGLPCTPARGPGPNRPLATAALPGGHGTGPASCLLPGGQWPCRCPWVEPLTCWLLFSGWALCHHLCPRHPLVLTKATGENPHLSGPRGRRAPPPPDSFPPGLPSPRLHLRPGSLPSPGPPSPLLCTELPYSTHPSPP